MILREGALLGTLGIAIGITIALIMTRFISNLLFGVTATDPAVFGSVAGTFMAVTLLACYVPARRATRIDPQVALRDS
jgi:ABC-type antimicrobial peptide transport system permease subunit